MKHCFHKKVCKHLIVLGDNPDGPCAIVEACKFYVSIEKEKQQMEHPRQTDCPNQPMLP